MFRVNVTRRPGRPVGQSDDLSVDELKRILAIPDKRTKDGLRDYTVLLILANTPMRKGELIRLTVGSLVDEGQKKFIAYQGLKKRKRKGQIEKKPYWLKIPVTADVFDSILRYVKSEHKTGKLDHNAPLILTLGKHGPYKKKSLTDDAVEGIVARYVAKAGIKKRITPHSFRATYLTLRGKGHDPATLIRLSGHADIRGVMPYLRSSEEKAREAALSVTVS